MPTVNELASQAIKTLQEAYNATTKYIAHPIYNVMGYGAKADATTNDASVFANAVTDAKAKGGTVSFSAGNYRIATDITVPSNVTLHFQNGAALNIDAAATVTINGPINAGLHQIFAGAGKVAGNMLIPFAYPHWWGAKGDGVTDDATAIQSALDARGKVYLSDRVFSISKPIEFEKDQLISGTFNSFGGTVLKPTGDFPAFRPKMSNTAIDFTRNVFHSLMLDGTNVITKDLIEFSGRCYLTFLHFVFIQKAGVYFEDSDSIIFNQCRIMDLSNRKAVTVRKDARSIHFIGCNVEATPNTRGKIDVDVSQGLTDTYRYPTPITFNGGQFERVDLTVTEGSGVQIRGTKASYSRFMLGHRSANCTIECIDDGANEYLDFGYNNKLCQVKGVNVGNSGSLELSREVSPEIPVNDVYGEVSKEYLLFSTAVARDKNATGVKIQFKDNTDVVLEESASFELPSSNETQPNGGASKVHHTAVTALSVPATKTGIKVTTTAASGRAELQNYVARNLLTNGTFAGQAITGWNLRQATSSFDANGFLTLTPSGTTPGMYQTVNLVAGRQYMLVARTTNGQLVFGEYWDGRDGYRRSSNLEMYPHPSNDGSKLGMAFFKANKSESINISIGLLEVSAEIKIKWIALVDLTQRPTILYSPNGTRYRLKVDDAGALSTIQI